MAHRGLAWLLDGARPWGSFDVWPDRFGAIRYRLIIYPPGISATERRRLRVWRGWPIWGALLFVVSETGLSQLTRPWTAFAYATAAYLGSGAWTFIRCGNSRRRVRAMFVMVMTGYQRPISSAQSDKLEELAERLLEADDQLRHGLMSAVQHEMTWWRTYDEAGRFAATGMQRAGA